MMVSLCHSLSAIYSVTILLTNFMLTVEYEERNSTSFPAF